MKKNLCLLCKSNQNKNHNIINYDQKNYISYKHWDNFSSYCNTYKKNLYAACYNEHGNREIINFGKIFHNQNDLKNKIRELKNAINKFKEKIKKIIEFLNNLSDNKDLVYSIIN